MIGRCMADARFRIVFAGPHVAFQDGGRPGLMRFGVTRSGPMDSLAHAAANLAVGRPADATADELAVFIDNDNRHLVDHCFRLHKGLYIHSSGGPLLQILRVFWADGLPRSAGWSQ